MADFAINVRQWVEKAKGNVDAATYAVGLAVVERVKELTPVKTGYLRSSWQMVPETKRNSLLVGLHSGLSSAASDIAQQQVQQRLKNIPGFVGKVFGGSVGGFVVSQAVGAATGPETSLEGSILGTIGGAVGGFLGSYVGPAGTLAGSSVGNALGTTIGEMFSGTLSQHLKGTALEPIANMIGTTDKMGGVIYIVNPAPYARRIEYGFVGEDSLGRRYNYQGVGMMQQAISELPAIAEEALKEFGR